MRGGKKYLWERNYDENGYKEILYYEGGQKKSEGNHKKDGALDGRWVEYYPDGRIQKEGSYKDGKQAGKWTEYDEEGNIVRARTFRNGIALTDAN